MQELVEQGPVVHPSTRSMVERIEEPGENLVIVVPEA